MSRNEFLLPNELGWEANDKIGMRLREYANAWATSVMENMNDEQRAHVMSAVLTAEAMDDVYAIIKKYQKEK